MKTKKAFLFLVGILFLVPFQLLQATDDSAGIKRDDREIKAMEWLLYDTICGNAFLWECMESRSGCLWRYIEPVWVKVSLRCSRLERFNAVLQESKLVDLNFTTYDGDSLLMHAVKNLPDSEDITEIIKVLLKRAEIDINYCFRGEFSPFGTVFALAVEERFVYGYGSASIERQRLIESRRLKVLDLFLKEEKLKVHGNPQWSEKMKNFMQLIIDDMSLSVEMRVAMIKAFFCKKVVAVADILFPELGLEPLEGRSDEERELRDCVQEYPKIRGKEMTEEEMNGELAGFFYDTDYRLIEAFSVLRKYSWTGLHRALRR